MIITPYFCFLHLPKTGGTYIIESIKRSLELPIIFELRHGAHKNIPQQFNSLPTCAVVRNPWTWYTSAFSFSKLGRHGPTTELMLAASNDFKNSFQQTLLNILEPNDDLIEHMYQSVLAQRKNLDPESQLNALEPDFLFKMRSENIGLLTYLSEQIIPNDVTFLWEQETLRRSYFKFLATLPIERQQLQKALRLQDQNISPKQPLTSLFNPQLVELIKNKDAKYIEKFNYQYPPELYKFRTSNN